MTKEQKNAIFWFINRKSQKLLKIMNPKTTVKSSLLVIYTVTLQTLRKKPAVYVPFIIFALFELFLLLLVYLAPRMPVRIFLGPPIKTLWGERFLHYPLNFLLLPKLASLSRMVLSIFLGSLTTGIAVAILYQKEIKSVLKKYALLFLTVLFTTALFYVSTKTAVLLLAKYFMAGHSKLLFLKTGLWMGPILTVLNFTAAIFAQALFVYVIPKLIISNENFIKTILGGFVFFQKHFILTLTLVGLPMMLYTPIIILNQNALFLMNKVYPEFLLWVAVLGTVISSFIIDPLITVSTALFYLNKKNDEKIF